MIRRGRIIMYAGVALVVGGLCKAHAVVHEYSWSGSSRFAWSVAYTALLGLAAYSVGLPEQPRTRRSAFLSSLLATSAAALVVSGVQLFVGDALLPRFVVLGGALICIPWFLFCAVFTQDADVRAGDRTRLVVVATADELATLEADLEQAFEQPSTLVGWLTPDEVAPVEAHPARPLVDMVRERNANVVVLSRIAQGNDAVVLQATALHGEGIRVRTLSMFYEQWLGKLPLGELERVSLLFDIGEVHAAGYARVKRALDAALAAVGVVALVLILPLVVLGNAIGNRGSLFYRQSRVGRNGVSFEILKFRTMRNVGLQASTEPTTQDDLRITRFGGFLRRTHLDELPQVVNIFRGELSVVGPRPEQPQIVAELVGKIPYYELRHLVRPGLTGWAQVKYQYAGTESETLEKLQYEFFYLRHQSLGLDLRIVGRTLRTVAGQEGR
jgi:lipopolysaccharide/colanic/teichoic acid biosynthesis glycosyltransferase